MDRIEEIVREHQQVAGSVSELKGEIASAGGELVRCLRAGGKVLWMGNGGSAADAQHMAAELVGRYARERTGLASIALTTDSSILTAIGNDFGYDRVFGRQIEALCRAEDVVVAISTSGNSPNLLLGVERAKEIGAFTIALTGRGGGRLGPLADLEIRVPSDSTARIQEAHLLVEHILCELVDEALAG